MAEPLEIELKYRVDDGAVFVALAYRLQLGEYDLRPLGDSERQVNTYFDTPDFRLRAARYGLRVRRIATRRIVTLKGDAQVRDGLHQRAEWEMPVESDEPRDWPPGEARDRALALAGDAPLLPILTIETLRRHVEAWRDARYVAEIALDEGVIFAAGREQTFRELEIELRPDGGSADLEVLGNLLRWRFGLEPDDRSKLARGMALLSSMPDGEK